MKGLFIISLVITYSFLLYGQENILVPITNLSSVDNKSLANVRAILKDKNGFVWIGTQDGLIRYDGRNAVAYNKNTLNPSYAIMNNDIDALISFPSSNFLWVLNSYAGVSKIELTTGKVQKKIRLFTENNPSSNLLYTGIEFHNKFIFITTEDGYIFKLNSESDDWSAKKIKFLSSNDKIQRFYSIGNHFLFFLTDSRVFVTDSLFERIIKQTIIPHQNDNFRVLTSAALKQHSILLGTSEGVKKLEFDGRLNELTISSFGKQKNRLEKVKNILVDSNNIWVAYDNSLVKYGTNENSESLYLTSKGYDENKWLRDATFLSNINGQIWIGSEYGIAIIKENNPFVPYFQNMGNTTKLSHCYALFPENDSIIYACTAEAFYKVNINTTSTTKIGNSAYYINCFRGPDEEIIVSGFGGTYIKQNNDLIPISKIYPLLSVLEKDVIIAAENFKDSIFFFASVLSNGLYIYNKKHKKIVNINTHTIPLDLKSNDIKRLYIDKHEILWILCNNQISLYDINKHTIKHFSVIHPESNEPLNIISDICNINNDFFLAVYGIGVVQIDEELNVKKIYANKEGIENVNLYKIFSIGDSVLITSGNYGLYTINTRTKKVKSFFEDYGLHSNSFEELSGAVNKNKIIMGGINGFTIISPALLKENNVNPVVFINKISVQLPVGKFDTSNILITSLDISKNALQTNIYFSGINYSNPLRTTFAYRIVEQGNEWINLDKQNFVTLIGLSPGKYHLQVKAFNEDGVPSEIKELRLIFLPKWYQTWWFKVVILLAIASAIFGLYRFRINQLKKEEKIRKQVAGDLHDELGSTLNSVKIFTNLALMEKENTSHLEKIKEATQSAISGVKDIIWVLDDKRDTLDHLLGRINQFARPICEAAGISYNQQSGGNENYKLGKEEKRNLYMIIKESINNSIKYADCSVIELLIKNNGGKINISISDNGKGFDKNETVSGYGLKNIVRRSEEINYRAEINSSPGNGTLIYLEKK